MRDSEIEQWVLHEIRVTTGNRLKEVCVLSVSGVVNLNGTVQSRAERLAVQTAAAQANGVVAVINQLKVRRRESVRRRAQLNNQFVSIPVAFPFPNQEHVSNSQVAS